MALIHVYEKLGQGIDILATSPGPIKERLLKAFLDALAEVPEDALPPEARQRWQQVWQRVTAAQGKPGEGRLVASIQALDEDEATLIAEHIVTIHALVQLAVPSKGSGRSANVAPVGATSARPLPGTSRPGPLGE